MFVQATREIFDNNKKDPPLSKNQPPVAGAIAWARALYMRVRQTIIRFNDAGLLRSEKGEIQRALYVSLARDIDDYCKHLYKKWWDHCQSTATEGLKQFILGPALIETKVSEGRTAYKLPQPPYYVNFSPDLTLLIKEARYLDRMGFAIPETVSVYAPFLSVCA